MGYIKLDRKMLEWEWYHNTNTKVLFLHCLLKANWKEAKFEGVTIPKGGFVTSYPHLAKQTGLSVQQVRTALEHLKSTGELTVYPHAKFSVVIVNNYIQYQDDNTVVNSLSTGNQQAINSLSTTIEEEKEGKKNKKKKEYIGAYLISENEVLQSAFNDFMEMRKAIKKPMTQRAITNMIAKLKRLSPDEYVQADILDQSINNSWQDVYPLKAGFVSTRVRPQKEVEPEEDEMTDEEWCEMVKNSDW